MPTTEETQALVPVLPCCQVRSHGLGLHPLGILFSLTLKVLITGSNGKKGVYYQNGKSRKRGPKG